MVGGACLNIDGVTGPAILFFMLGQLLRLQACMML